MSSNFQKVKLFNNVFGAQRYDEPSDEIFDDTKFINLRVGLIEEEIKELVTAFNERNMVEVVDAQCDIQYVVYGMGDTMGIDLDKAFEGIFGGGGSNFEMVKMTGNPFDKKFDATCGEIFDDTEFVTSAIELIEEGLFELKRAIGGRDMDGVVESLCNILYVTYGMADAMMINLDEAFDLVQRSNMSKSCSCEEDAIKTVQWYKDNEAKYDSPSYKKSDGGDYYVVYNESTKKILKSIYYSKVDLSGFVF